MQTPTTEFNETKLIHSQRPILNGDVSNIHRNTVTLSPLVEFIGPSTTDPSNMITANMTIKDRERRAALLADSPELPSKSSEITQLRHLPFVGLPLGEHLEPGAPLAPF